MLMPWIVENTLEVLDSLKSIPTRNAQLASFDFSTLYTAIPITYLKIRLLTVFIVTIPVGSPNI